MEYSAYVEKIEQAKREAENDLAQAMPVLVGNIHLALTENLAYSLAVVIENIFLPWLHR